jgi:hypothetical protein
MNSSGVAQTQNTIRTLTKWCLTSLLPPLLSQSLWVDSVINTYRFIGKGAELRNGESFFPSEVINIQFSHLAE